MAAPTEKTGGPGGTRKNALGGDHLARGIPRGTPSGGRIAGGRIVALPSAQTAMASGTIAGMDTRVSRTILQPARCSCARGTGGRIAHRRSPFADRATKGKTLAGGDGNKHLVPLVWRTAGQRKRRGICNAWPRVPLHLKRKSRAPTNDGRTRRHHPTLASRGRTLPADSPRRHLAIQRGANTGTGL